MKSDVSTFRRICACGASALAAAVIIAFSFSSCSRRVMPPAQAAQWIAAFSPAHIDMDSKIRIELTDLAKAKLPLNAQWTDYFDFSPSVKGSARLSADRRFLDFTPEKSLRQGKKYECRLDLRGLTDVDSLGDFRFDFTVERRELLLKDVVATVDPDDISMMTITGTMAYNTAAGDSLTADPAIITCDAPKATVTVAADAHRRTRTFTVRGVKRTSSPHTVTVASNPIYGFSRSEAEVEIPAIGAFRLLNSERIEAAEPYISLDFSAPLSSQQELDGLITLDGIAAPRIERDGCNVKIFYAPNGLTDLTLRVSELLKNHEGRPLDEDLELHFEQEVIPPAVEIAMDGNILPDDRNLRLPFRAVNLAAVDVEVVKIFPANVLSFLQENDLDESRRLRRFGRLVFRRTVRLDADKSLDLHRWQDFSIDLKGLFQRERGAIYNIRLSFRRAYSLYGRAEPEQFEETAAMTAEDERRWDKAESYIYRGSNDFSWDEYNWSDEADPSKPTYYMCAEMPERNVVASSLGLIVKKGRGGEFSVAATDLLSALPAAGIQVACYNFQLQKTASATTDAAGFATLRPSGTPFLITASDGRSTTYLKVTPGRELSVSNFDVGGTAPSDGLKGFVYGDRGVWRPGDDIHLTLLLDGTLPPDHPVVLELFTPQEQLYSRQTLSRGVDGFHVFHIATGPDAPTGSWEARFKVGNSTFRHKVRIETIKPNRLKIAIGAPDVIQANTPQPVSLSARWLSGPAAKAMQASLEMDLFSDPNPFEGYRKYSFSNPLVQFSSSQKQIFQEQLDSVGCLKKTCTVGADINSPGMLRANLTAKVTEPGGDVSISSRSARFSPFSVYVGIDLGSKEFLTDTGLRLPVVVLNRLGARLKTRELAYTVYRLDWDWWWEGGAYTLDRYVKSSAADIVASGSVTATDGHAAIPFRVNYPDWGKYLILVRDTRGGHATGGVFTVDWPDWRGRAARGQAAGSTELSLSLDKKSYRAGETATVFLPRCPGGRALLSVENGSRVIRKYWVNTSAENDTNFKLAVDGTLAPNFYISATLLRPHAATGENVPVRLFGVAGASVVDPASILHPRIDMPDELHPGQPFTLKVSEQSGRPMTYTLAIVDEGLLDITGFRTPDPWAAMNQREALGVKTWDMYDEVIGAFGSKFRPVLSIGGDEALRKAAGKEKRFNPVVKFLGPFTLGGGAKSHRITLPNYVGSVRVMLVAAHGGSYGRADRTVKVTSPLMLLTTLPRALCCGDAVDMPVNVFAMDSALRDVAVSVEASGPVTVAGAGSRRISFAAQGEKLVNFRLSCSSAAQGMARIVVTAASGARRMSDTTYIDVANPMPVLTDVVERTVAPGASETLTWMPQQARSASLQISTLPAINFAGSMAFFLNYPHLCSEQLASKALFMLYGGSHLSQADRSRCDSILPHLLKHLESRQLTCGGFAYWPGNSQADPWVTSMAGLALAEGARRGFRVNAPTLDNWAAYQEKAARDYRYAAATDLDQAFRLYTLAKAGHTLKPAMNRLRESKTLTQQAAFCLASAYGLDGRKDVAAKLIERAERTACEPARGMFRSEACDAALKLEAYALYGNLDKARPAARKVAALCSGSSYVTQDLAFAALAMHRLTALAGGAGKVSAKVAEHGCAPLSVQNIATIKNIPLAPASGSVAVANTGSTPLTASLITSYQPSPSTKLKPESCGLALTVAFTDLPGKPVSAGSLKQDTEFYARVTVANRGGDIQALALSCAIPSGWEIWNSRLFGGARDAMDHCDIRDDKVIFYTALEAGKKKTFTLRLRAAYRGRFVLPPFVCEDMYNPACRAISANSWVSVE